MKFLFSLIFIAIFYISLSESACSSENWKAVPFLDTSKILGRWFAFKVNGTGQERCLWHELYKNPKSDVIAVRSNQLFKDRKSSHVQGDLTYTNPTKQNGEISIAMQNGHVVQKFFVAIDYDEYAVVRACHGGVENFWVYLRNLNPTNETMERVNKIVDEQKPDQSKLVTT